MTVVNLTILVFLEMLKHRANGTLVIWNTALTAFDRSPPLKGTRWGDGLTVPLTHLTGHVTRTPLL